MTFGICLCNQCFKLGAVVLYNLNRFPLLIFDLYWWHRCLRLGPVVQFSSRKNITYWPLLTLIAISDQCVNKCCLTFIMIVELILPGESKANWSVYSDHILLLYLKLTFNNRVISNIWISANKCIRYVRKLCSYWRWSSGVGAKYSCGIQCYHPALDSPRM